MTAPPTIDDYIAGFPGDIQSILRNVRTALHEALPDAPEKIRYGMPALMLSDRYAIHFAAWKKHIGLYPVATAPVDLERDLAPYRIEKDTVRFLYSEPIPYDLITRIAAFLAARHRVNS